MSSILLSPVTLGALKCRNRIFMAPLTRCRAGAGNVPHALNVKYYSQRATAGLIVSEATQVSPYGLGYAGTPGIHSEEQVAGWKLVTDAVHAAGGTIVLQLWHVGRISHPSLLPGNALPVSSSAVKPRGLVHTPQGKDSFETPRALELQEIPEIVAQYKKGAENAKRAGFDGVELHGANGYLVDQFLRDGVNKRSDAYGGSVENRARFALEVIDALISVWGASRVGIRISPNGIFNDMSDSDPKKIFGYLAKELSNRAIAYLHATRPAEGESELVPLSFFRPIFSGKIFGCTGFDKQSAEEAVNSGIVDAVAFGKLFIANPDLPKRFDKSSSLNPWDMSTFYGGGEKGYTDYPALNPS